MPKITPNDPRWKISVNEVKLDSKTRSAINRALSSAGFDGNGRWPTVGHAHGDAGNILEKFGYEFSDMLTGFETNQDSKHLSLYISQQTPGDSFSPVPVKNTSLAFSYTKLRDRVYEVIAYLG